MNHREWQMVGEDSWQFGFKVRGVIREPLAEVYYDEEAYDTVEGVPTEGGWIWLVLGGRRGVSHSLGSAVVAAEEAMGVSR